MPVSTKLNALATRLAKPGHERCLTWNDQTLAVQWPQCGGHSEPILSTRERRAANWASIQQYEDAPDVPWHSECEFRLTAREREAPSLVGSALGNKEMARALGISEATIKTLRVTRVWSLTAECSSRAVRPSVARAHTAGPAQLVKPVAKQVRASRRRSARCEAS